MCGTLGKIKVKCQGHNRRESPGNVQARGHDGGGGTAGSTWPGMFAGASGRTGDGRVRMCGGSSRPRQSDRGYASGRLVCKTLDGFGVKNIVFSPPSGRARGTGTCRGGRRVPRRVGVRAAWGKGAGTSRCPATFPWACSDVRTFGGNEERQLLAEHRLRPQALQQERSLGTFVE